MLDPLSPVRHNIVEVMFPTGPVDLPGTARDIVGGASSSGSAAEGCSTTGGRVVPLSCLSDGFNRN